MDGPVSKPPIAADSYQFGLFQRKRAVPQHRGISKMLFPPPFAVKWTPFELDGVLDLTESIFRLDRPVQIRTCGL